MRSFGTVGKSRPAQVAGLTALAVVASLLSLATPAAAATGYTAWQMSGDEQDPIVGTSTYSFAPPVTTFTLTGTAQWVHITAIQSGGGHSWSADFRGPDGLDLIAGTTYTDSERAADVTTNHPGLDINGDGKACNTLNGSFTINELVVDDETGAVTAFAATFDQHCDRVTPAARGTILYNATNPIQLITTTTLTGPASVPPGTRTSLTGSLTDASGPVVDADLEVTRDDASGTTDLGVVTTDSGGAFGLDDTLGTSDATYTASYAGDAEHQASSKTFQVKAIKTAPVLTISAPAKGTRDRTMVVSGTLTAAGAPVAGVQLSVKRVDAIGTTTRSVVTSDTGTYSVSDVPAIGGNVLFTTSWVGDATRAAVTSSTATVLVGRRATSLTVRASASLYPYRGQAKVVAHLGTTYNARWVSIYARPLGTSMSAPGTLIARGRVNSNGNLAGYYTMTHRTTFTASFGGDYRYLPATATVTPTVTSHVTLTFSGYVGKSGSYLVFANSDPQIRVGVSPLRTSGCVSVLSQVYSAATWKTTSTLSCAQLDSTSHAYLIFTSARHQGSRYRMRASVGNSSLGAPGTSSWVYWTYS